jgi:hypothetical protein
MDGLRFSGEDRECAPLPYEAAVEAPPGPALDDRRTYVRAFNRWVALLYGRACPDIRDVEPGSLEGPNNLLLDLRDGRDDPAIRLVGAALRRECGGFWPARLSDVPADSLLACAAAHYPMVLSTGEPIAFDGEHRSADGTIAIYRGILLPYSSGGGTADLVHGMINWRTLADGALAADIAFEAGRAFAAMAAASAGPLWGGSDLAPVTALYEPPQPELPLGR